MIERKTEFGMDSLSGLASTMERRQGQLLEQLEKGALRVNLDDKYRKQYLYTIQQLVTEQVKLMATIII